MQHDLLVQYGFILHFLSVQDNKRGALQQPQGAYKEPSGGPKAKRPGALHRPQGKDFGALRRPQGASTGAPRGNIMGPSIGPKAHAKVAKTVVPELSLQNNPY
jgi:hypothetical protein